MTNRWLGCFVLCALLAVSSTAHAITGPSTLSFDDTRAGATSATETLTVTNSSNAAVPYTTSITGNFTIIGGASGSIGANSTADLTLQFTPGGVGLRMGTLVVMGNTNLTVSLTGTGTEARIDVGDLALGPVPRGGSAMGNVRVANTATGAGSLGNMVASIDTDTSNAFSFVSASCTDAMCAIPGTLTAGQSTNIAVRCSPPLGASGTLSARIYVASDTDPVADVLMEGMLTCTVAPPVAVLTPTSFAFPPRAVNTMETKEFVVSNTGDSQFTYSVVGLPTGPFSAVGGCVTNCTVPAQGMNSFDVQFRPTAVGDFNAVIMVTTNDPVRPSFTIPLSGRGNGPLITATPPAVSFGAVDIGDTSPMIPVQIMNTGNTDLTIATAMLSGSPDFASMPPASFMTLTPGQFRVWNFTCTPISEDGRTASFVVTSNSVVAPTLTVPLTCSGQRGVLSANQTALAFGGVPIGGSDTRTVVVTNIGNAPVENFATAIAPADLGYSVMSITPPGTTLAPDATKTLTVLFAPTELTDGGAATLTASGTWGTGKTTMVTVTLTGQALSTGFDLLPATLVDFMDVRYDSEATRQLCARNSSMSTLRISDVSFANAEPTLPSEIEFTNWRLGTIDCTSGATVPAPSMGAPTSVAPGQSLIFDVKWKTRLRVGPLTGRVVVTSLLPTTPTRDVAVGGTSTSGVLELGNGGMVDFGPVDIQSGGTTRQVTVRNVGNAAFTIPAVSPLPDDSPFTEHFPASAVLEPGASMEFAVDYRPTAVSAPGSEERATIAFTVPDALSMPAATIGLAGRGIDRVLSLGRTPDFPPTFKNPGTAGPVAPLTIRNDGEAPLHVTMLMPDSPNWQLVDPNMQNLVIPGNGGSVEVPLRFTPTVDELVTSELLITSDDSPEITPPFVGVARVTLTGLGLKRGVSFAPGPVDLGFTGTNFPVEIERAVVVRNMDTVNTFTIRELTIEPASRVFSFTEDPTNIVLQPLEERPFTIRFAPVDADRFEYGGTITLYLDEDPVPHDTIPMEGRALFVDARGGGGCSTSGGGSGGAAAWLVGLVAIVLGRRRRRRAAQVIAAAAVIAGSGAAATAEDLVLSTFDPTPETQPTNFQVQSGVVGPSGDWVASAALSYASDPLVQLSTGPNGTAEQSVIERSALLQLGGAFAFLDRWEVGARMPLYSQSGDVGAGGGDIYSVEPVSGSARGDLVLHAKARLIHRPLAGKGLAAIAAGAQLTLPTATEGAFTGVEYPTGKLLVLASLMPGAFSNRVSLSANAGAIIRARSEYANLEQRSGAVWGLGLQIRALDRVWLAGEAYGTWMPSGRNIEMGQAKALSPMEWLAGVKVRPDHRFTIGVAAGRGLTSAAGAPALRGVLSLTFTPYAEKLKPIHPPPPPKPDGDEDLDSLKDSKDACPKEAEDVDGFEDEDGCPELDNDKDGLADLKDKCPLDEEDIDKFEDLDGCPDLDNDQDGIADLLDQCGTVAEDKDKFQDEDGCPEPDNDKDGILDVADKCPLKAEVVNGKADDDGCPDQGESVVALSSDKLEVMETIAFTKDSPKLIGKSTNVLAQIAATLRAHPEILKVRVTCHVNPTGNDQRDQELSDARANAVREWLVKWGIAGSRLDTRGFGGKKPLAKSGRNAAAMNDRVELIILERQ